MVETQWNVPTPYEQGAHMTDKQLGIIYTVMLTVWLASMLGLAHYLDKPMSAEDYADKLCQELYGPQVGHKWVDATLMCETVRGEYIQLRKK
jgi:hypothetical protein